MTPEQWSKKLNGYFIGFCRRVFHWSPAYKEVVQSAEATNGKDRLYLCASCGNLVKRSEKQVDHVEPVVKPGEKWDGDWNSYRDRLFVTSEKLQVLCKECHKSKTGKENKERRKKK